VKWSCAITTHLDVDCAVFFYFDDDAEVVEFPTMSVKPGNSQAADMFGNKRVYHVHTDGDIYVLPDNFSTRPYHWDNTFYIQIDGADTIGPVCDIGFVRIGKSRSGPRLPFSFKVSYKGNHEGDGGRFNYTISGKCNPVDGGRFSVSIKNRWGTASGTGSMGTIRNAWYPPFWGTASCPYENYDPPFTDQPYRFTLNLGAGFYWTGRMTDATRAYSFTEILRNVTIQLKGMFHTVETVYANRFYRADIFAETLSKCIDGYRYLSINTAQYLRDLTKVKDILKDFRNLRRAPLSKKAWSKIYFQYRYGLRLTVLDTNEILKGIRRFMDKQPKWVSTRGISKHQVPSFIFGYPITVEGHMKLYCKPFDTTESGILEQLRQVDLLPSASNLWDFVPYSFVVDWFLPIGAQLERFDNQRDMDILPIISSCWSVKSSMTWTYDGFGAKGTVKSVAYERYVDDPTSMKSKLNSVSLNFLSGISLIHLFDGLGLKLQRGKAASRR
jgi:hypothetical protein